MEKAKNATYVTRLVTQVEGEREIIEQTYAARWLKRGERHLLKYEEAENKGHTMLTVAPGFARLHRQGLTSSLLHFESGKRVDARYRTPMGALSLLIDTHDYRLETSGDGGRWEARYSILVNGRKVSENTLQAAWSENNL